MASACSLGVWPNLKSQVASEKPLSFLSFGCSLARAVLQLQQERSLPQALQVHAFMRNINQVTSMPYVLVAKDASVNKTDFEFPCLHGTYILVREGQKRNNK